MGRTKPIIRRPPCLYLLADKGRTANGVRICDGDVDRIRRSAKWRLLHFVQLLIDEHREKRQQKYSRANTEYPHRDRELVDLR